MHLADDLGFTSNRIRRLPNGSMAASPSNSNSSAGNGQRNQRIARLDGDICGDAVLFGRLQRWGWAGFDPAITTSGSWFSRRYWPGVMPYSRRNWRLKLERF